MAGFLLPQKSLVWYNFYMINPESFKNEAENKWRKSFDAEETTVPYVFRISEDTIFTHIHFDEGVFKHPKDKKEVSIEDFIDEIKSSFPSDKILVSCCYPDKARALLPNDINVEILGEGDTEYKTLYIKKEKKIIVESV